MEIVNTLDIDGTQWGIQDAEARSKIATLESDAIVKDLEDIEINMKSGYTAKQARMFNHYKIGKIHFMSVAIENIDGNYIGTYATVLIGSINIHPKKQTYFILHDYLNNAALRCQINTDGAIEIGESVGVVKGNNSSLGELIFAEE